MQALQQEFYVSCNDMICKWEQMVSRKGSCEVDVWPYLDNLSGDVISRAAFGSNFQEGKKIFKLQKEQIALAMKFLQQVYIPGLRYIRKIALGLNIRRLYLCKKLNFGTLNCSQISELVGLGLPNPGMEVHGSPIYWLRVA